MDTIPNAPAPTEAIIPIADIEVGARLRNVKEGKMKEIAESIAAIGLAQAITVSRHPTKTTGDPPRPVYLLEAGAYRLEAHKHLGRTEIRANVTGLTGDLLALLQTDENLMRADLDDLERADFLAARKEIYERLHPETKKGVAQGEGMRRTAKAKSVPQSQIGSEVKTEELPKQPSFVEDTAEKTGRSETSIHRDLERVNKITDEAQALIRGTWIAKAGMELDKIKQLTPENQLKHIEKLLKESYSKEARYAPRKSGGSGTKRQSNGSSKPMPKSSEPVQHHGDGNPQHHDLAKKLDPLFDALWLISADARAKATEIENVLAQRNVIPVSDRKRDSRKHLRDLQEKAPKSRKAGEHFATAWIDSERRME